MSIVISFAVGFVVGALVFRNNAAKGVSLVDKAKELLAKAKAALSK